MTLGNDMNNSVRSFRSFSDLPEDESLKFLGIIPTTSGRGASKCGKSWTFSMEVDAWKVVGGPLVESRVLLVFRQLNESQVESLMDRLSDMSLISFVARRPKGTLKPKHYPQPVRLELESLSLSKTQDGDLRKIKSKHAEATQFEDPIFGTIVYDRFWKSYYVKGASFKGSKMSVAFKATKREELESLLKEAKNLWSKRLQWFNAWREFVYESCFDIAAKQWIESKPLTKKQFLQLLGWPCCVTFFRRDGKFAFELQGNNRRIFKAPGVFIVGTTLTKFDKVGIGKR